MKLSIEFSMLGKLYPANKHEKFSKKLKNPTT